MRRLNPTSDRSEDETLKVGRALMQPICGSDGQVFGRAFIAPSRHSFSPDGGWVTISGLRAARLHVEGVLLGEAVTAARDSAQPIATPPALAQWATKQAALIATSVKDEERQARSGEVLLECGGDIGACKLIKWGADWLEASELEDRLRSSTELVISFDGEFDYDEDQDDVHPKEFREEFQLSEEIALVLRHDGTILRVGSNTWPQSITGNPKWSDSNVAAYVRNIIREVWGNDVFEDEEERVVGKVGFSEISRRLSIFRPNDKEPF